MVNRCQQDIAQRRSIREARASEQEFFRHHPAYAEVAAKCGTKALGRTVSRILAEHVADLLPSLQDKIVSRRNEASRELAALGNGRPDDPAGQAAVGPVTFTHCAAVERRELNALALESQNSTRAYVS